MIYLQLFWEFFKVGLFSIGGGLATIPFLNELADKTQWFSREMLVDMLAVSESTPGPIGVNTATYIGFDLCGVLGAIIATFGLVTPSVICIVLIAQVLERFKSSDLVQNAFSGIRPAAIGLIACAGIEVLGLCLLHTVQWTGNLLSYLTKIVDWPAMLLLLVLLYLSNKFNKAHPIIFIAIGAAVGILRGLF